ncbi:hypothetical protein [Aquibacillus kalidii]|nr:hypothetical protein [Aquibacillus kalidii]
MSETEQLKKLLSTIYKQANNGADYQEIMSIFKEELPKITANKTIILK